MIATGKPVRAGTLAVMLAKWTLGFAAAAVPVVVTILWQAYEVAEAQAVRSARTEYRLTQLESQVGPKLDTIAADIVKIKVALGVQEGRNSVLESRTNGNR